VMILSLVSTVPVYAQGILPGEPDPNTSPRRDSEDKDQSPNRALVDDRAQCPHGMKRFQKMKCGTAKDTQECQNYSPVLECRSKSVKLHCKKPKTPVPVYRCE
jgi:hypothetical protein